MTLRCNTDFSLSKHIKFNEMREIILRADAIKETGKHRDNPRACAPKPAQQRD